MIQSLDRPQLLALLGAARASSERNWLMVLVAFCHGLRASEVVGLTPDNFSNGFLDTCRLKGSERTIHPLVSHPEPLLSEVPKLFEYASKFAPNQKIFPVSRQHFWRLVQRLGQAAGLPEHLRHPHILKHTICMQTIHSAGIENVRVYVGHKSISSTGEYLKVPQANAARAVGDAFKL